MIATFVLVCLGTLVMAITATVHTMKQVMETHQFLVAFLKSVGVHLDMIYRTTPVW
jgi:predicted lysophospholipase L1 biosynthesis ABC-type transport system permease subunit